MAHAGSQRQHGEVNLLGRIGLAVALAPLVPAVAVGLLLWNGAISPAQAVGLPDPGALTRWGLPVSRAVRDLSAAVTIGALVLAAVAIPPEKASEPGQLSGVRARALAGAAAFGFLWAWAGLAVVCLPTLIWQDSVRWRPAAWISWPTSPPTSSSAGPSWQAPRSQPWRPSGACSPDVSPPWDSSSLSRSRHCGPSPRQGTRPAP